MYRHTSTAAPTPAPWPSVQCESVVRDAPVAVSVCYQHGSDNVTTCDKSLIGPNNSNGEQITVVLDTMMVRWNRAEASLFPKSTTSATTRTTSSSRTIRPTYTYTPTPPPSGLRSTGEKIALSMGVIFGAAILALVVILWHRNDRQKRREAAKPAIVDLPPYSPPTRGLTGTEDEPQDLPPAYHRNETDPNPQPPSYVASTAR
ncbi:hypothetical protein B0T22DRAFT_449053 [Podospora appendiculata]|uniref:Mid2 domain-containing protein n=1 Tax=Podospora appendiculata TaxID=314037 RepID=A0AAE1CFY7_9PEZI|nr:hypothetical protein B0T22DRAFT_449053 [Podospora appendiculata]